MIQLMQKHQGLGSHISVTSRVFKFDEHKLQPNTLQFPPGDFLLISLGLVCATGFSASNMGHVLPYITLYFLDSLLLLRMLTLGQYQIPVF